MDTKKIRIKSTMEYVLEFPPVHEGPCSKVYKAQDLSLKRTVGIKEVDCSKLDRRVRQTVKSEINVWCDYACKTNRLPQIFYYHEEGDKYYIIMQWIEGKSLRECMKSEKLSFNMKLNYCLQLCDALAPIHKERKQHKDLKPENIMIASDRFGPRLYLLDFNISAAVPHVKVGTSGYLAPELDEISDSTDTKRVDVFAIGTIMYELFTGVRPAFGVDYVSNNAWDKKWYDFKKPSSENPELPEKLDKIIEKCMALNPDDRYRNASEIAYDLRPLSKAKKKNGGEHK